MKNRQTQSLRFPGTLKALRCILSLCSAAAITAIITIALPGEAISASKKDVKWDITKTGSYERDVDFSIMGGFSSVGRGLAGGARLAIPLLDDGFIDEINDALFLEFGGHYSWNWQYSNSRQDWHYNWGLTIPVQARWQFYVHPKWEVFASLGIAFRSYSDDDAIRWMAFIPYPAGGVGAFYKFQDNMALRFDAGSEALSVGLTWKF